MTAPENFPESFSSIPIETKTNNTKTYILVGLLALFLLVLPTLAYTFLIPSDKTLSGPPLADPSITPVITQPEPTPEIPPPTPITPLPTGTKHISVLLLGRGGANHSGGALTDSMTQVVFYPTTAKISLIGIPRDTYIEAGQPKRWMKINHSFPESAENTKLAVEAITGIKVDHYVVIDFDSFIKLIDSLGGIDVNVQTAFNDPYYPIKGEENNTCNMTPEQIIEVHQKYSGFNLEKQFTCRYENLVFNKGITKMNGATALKYVRSRHSGTYGSDFARLERASSVLTAIFNSLVTKLSTTSLTTIYNDTKKFVGTDISFDNLLLWKIDTASLPSTTIKNIPLTSDLFVNGTSPLGEFILEPKAGRGGWGPIQNYINSKQ